MPGRFELQSCDHMDYQDAIELIALETADMVDRRGAAGGPTGLGARVQQLRRRGTVPVANAAAVVGGKLKSAGDKALDTLLRPILSDASEVHPNMSQLRPDPRNAGLPAVPRVAGPGQGH